MSFNKIPLGEAIKKKVSSISSKFPFNPKAFQNNPESADIQDNTFLRSSYSNQEAPNIDIEAFKEAIIEGDDGGKLSDFVKQKLIYEAGVDREGQLMLIFCACNLPDNRTTDYDRLLNLIMFRLDDFVENDYTLIFFAAETQHKPNLKWLFKAYRRLTRNPKFSKKVMWVKTLSDLAAEVPLDQINIPDQVYSHNYQLESKIKSPDFVHQRRFFGVPLETLMGENGEKGVPPVVLDVLDYMFSYTLEIPDLFRRNSSKPTVRKIISEYESLGRNSVAYALYDEYAASSVLKAWISELPQPLLPIQLYDLVKAIPLDKSEHEAAIYIRDIVLPAMSDPPCIAILLSVLVRLFCAVAENSDVNNMTPAKIAVAWAPTWVKSNQPGLDVEMVSVTRFNIATPVSDDESEQQNKNENQKPSNVITLIVLMIQFFDVIFLPTMENYSHQMSKNNKSTLDNLDQNANTVQSVSTNLPPAFPPRKNSNEPAVTKLANRNNEQAIYSNKSTDSIRQGSVFSDTGSDMLDHNTRDIVSNHQLTSADILERLKLEDTQKIE
ncbi:hypothetical protein BB561_002897 [Smittium simulii]|uniref:Rho-GAP domain-containing protein n=1 Tax=Smittium simulii TaxID=133385 RepID=A0A2T9YNQ3_9FUNG|nr:hypothetical protein BB561_002897 [Smittium simulii]